MEEVRQAGVGDRLCEALGKVGRTLSFTPVKGELCKVLSRGGMTRLRCSLVPSGCCKGNRHHVRGPELGDLGRINSAGPGGK